MPSFREEFCLPLIGAVNNGPKMVVEDGCRCSGQEPDASVALRKYGQISRTRPTSFVTFKSTHVLLCCCSSELTLLSDIVCDETLAPTRIAEAIYRIGKL